MVNLVNQWLVVSCNGQLGFGMVSLVDGWLVAFCDGQLRDDSWAF